MNPMRSESTNTTGDNTAVPTAATITTTQAPSTVAVSTATSSPSLAVSSPTLLHRLSPSPTHAATTVTVATVGSSQSPSPAVAAPAHAPSSVVVAIAAVPTKTKQAKKERCKKAERPTKFEEERKMKKASGNATAERTIAAPSSTTDTAAADDDPASPPRARADVVHATSVASPSPAGANAKSGASAVSPPPTAAQALVIRPRPMGKQPRPMGKQPREQTVRAREGGDDEHQDISDGEEEEEDVDEDDDSSSADNSDDTNIDERHKVSGGRRPASTPSGFSKIKPPMKRLVVPDALPSGVEPIERIVDYRGNPGKYTTGLAVFEVSKKKEWVDFKAMRNMHVLKYDLEMVRLWKESGVDSLARYLNTKVGKVRKAPPHGADNDRMTCGYDSVGIALGLLSLPNPVTPNLISEFRTVDAKRRKLSAEKFERLGVTWPALRAFARTLGLIDMATLDKNGLWRRCGCAGCTQPYGWYLPCWW